MIEIEKLKVVSPESLNVNESPITNLSIKYIIIKREEQAENDKRRFLLFLFSLGMCPVLTQSFLTVLVTIIYFLLILIYVPPNAV